jgi:hypothetical protein
LGIDGIEATILAPSKSNECDTILAIQRVGVPMPSPKLTNAFLALEAQKNLPLPMAALILGAISQVEALIEVADRVCDPVFRHPISTTRDCG